MSIDAVTSRISQIVAMQQQLTDPSSSPGSASSSSSSSATPGTSATDTSPGAATGTGSASFSNALSSALGTGSTGSTSALGTDTTTAVNSALSPASLMASAIGGTDTTTGASDTTTGAPDTSSTLTSDLASLLPATSSLGLSTGSTLGTSAATGTSGTAAAQVQAMTNTANSLVGRPYVYGGGHSGWGPQSGYDCSGFVSAVLHAGGYLSQPVDTTALPNQPGMESGPGQYVTVYDRALPGQSGHVIIEINGQFYESGGSHGAWGGGGGVEKIGTPSAQYLSQFPNVLHPAGL
jgi:cell wall-associated NlpC family hydrolase